MHSVNIDHGYADFSSLLLIYLSREIEVVSFGQFVMPSLYTLIFGGVNCNIFREDGAEDMWMIDCMPIDSDLVLF